MSPHRNKLALRAIIQLLERYSPTAPMGDLNDCGFAELVQILDQRLTSEMGITVRHIEIPPLRKYNRN